MKKSKKSTVKRRKSAVGATRTTRRKTTRRRGSIGSIGALDQNGIMQALQMVGAGMVGVIAKNVIVNNVDALKNNALYANIGAAVLGTIGAAAVDNVYAKGMFVGLAAAGGQGALVNGMANNAKTADFAKKISETAAVSGTGDEYGYGWDETPMLPLNELRSYNDGVSGLNDFTSDGIGAIDTDNVAI